MSRSASGLQAWAVQRLSALYLAAFFVYLIVGLILDAPGDVAAWRGQVGGDVASIAWMLFVIALCWHAWIGVRDVVIDYLHVPVLRLGVLTAFGGALLASALWGIRIILQAAGG